jgi:hypothetical protein
VDGKKVWNGQYVNVSSTWFVPWFPLMSSHTVFSVTLHVCKTSLYNSHSWTYCRDPMLSSDFASVKSPETNYKINITSMKTNYEQIAGYYCSQIQTWWCIYGTSIGKSEKAVMLNICSAFLCLDCTMDRSIILCLSFDKLNDLKIYVSGLHIQTLLFHCMVMYL